MIVIHDMPTMRDVETATPSQLVAWHHRLRPTMMNDELVIVKAIARRYDAIPENVRAPLVVADYRTHSR